MSNPNWPIEKYRDAIYVDLETVGNTPLSPILEIGAVRMRNGIVTSTLQLFPNIDEQISLGMVPNWSTMSWWMDDVKVSPLARRIQIEAKRQSVAEVLSALTQWVDQQKTEHSPEGIPNWGNAPSFDQAIIRTLCLKAGVEYPLNFRTEVDYRDLLRKFSKQDVADAWKVGTAAAVELMDELGLSYASHSGLSDAAKEAFTADHLLLQL